MAASVSREAAWRQLETVQDPELGASIVSLGLVYGLTVDGSSVHVRLTMTTPLCPLEDYFRLEVNKALKQLPGISAVNVEFVFEPPWSPGRMKPAVRAQLGLPAA